MALRHILIVEDDETLRSLLQFTLEQEGHRLSTADSARGMFDVFRDGGIDLIILDLTLPDEDGLALVRQLRARSSIPVLVLTGRRDRDSRLAALELGADDFVTKPFDPKEVMLRVRNLLARSGPQIATDRKNVPPPIRFDVWTLDLDGRILSAQDGKTVGLTPGEFIILSVLVQNPGRAISRDRLLDAIASGDDPPSPRMIDVHVTQLRAKIERNRRKPVLISTVRGHGYRFDGKIK